MSDDRFAPCPSCDRPIATDLDWCPHCESVNREPEPVWRPLLKRPAPGGSRNWAETKAAMWDHLKFRLFVFLFVFLVVLPAWGVIDGLFGRTAALVTVVTAIVAVIAWAIWRRAQARRDRINRMIPGNRRP